jgi:hypothetical protein
MLRFDVSRLGDLPEITVTTYEVMLRIRTPEEGMQL